MKLHSLLAAGFMSLGGSVCGDVQLEPETVPVTGGTFWMGCTEEQAGECMSDERPAVEVQLPDFRMGKYEVTNAQFAKFLSDQSNQVEDRRPSYSQDERSLIEERESAFQPREGFEDHPVTNVSWYGARAYARWLAQRTEKPYRLPTEAEWEYAARGGSVSNGHVYSGSDVLEEVAWFSANAIGSGTGWGFPEDTGVHPIGLKRPNELGLHDMSGNAWEWCADFYENRHMGGWNPKGADSSSLRVLRGGSWDNSRAECRVSARGYDQHVSRFAVNNGFRVCLGDEDRDVKGRIDQFAVEEDFHGAILVKRGRETLYQDSFGLADRESSVRHTNRARFPIASITKLFTATLVLQLREEGKLHLSDPIDRYLPEYRGPASDKVRIHHLLTHTSGIQNCEEIGEKSNGIPEIYCKALTLKEIVAAYCSGPLESEAGSGFEYNNGDYILLGRIVEVVSQRPFHAALEERILKPLNLSDTGVILRDEDVHDLAKGYRWNEGRKSFERDAPMRYQNYSAAGAMYSTCSDLATFADVLFDGRLLDDDSIRLLVRTYPETQNYGYGIWVRYPRYNNTVPKVVQRFGRIGGINALVSHFIDQDLTVIILANTDKVDVSRLQEIVGESLLD